MKKLSIRVLPRSSRNEVVGEMADGTLKVKLTAPPVDGEANKQLVDLLSKHFDVPKSHIEIIKGQASKNKIVQIKNSL